MKRYVVTLKCEARQTAEVFVEAETPTKAKAKAKALADEGMIVWHTTTSSSHQTTAKVWKPAHAKKTRR